MAPLSGQLVEARQVMEAAAALMDRSRAENPGDQSGLRLDSTPGDVLSHRSRRNANHLFTGYF